MAIKTSNFNITLLPSKIQFVSESSSTILSSALDNDIHMEYSCSDGACGACRVKLIEGQVSQPDSSEGLSAQDKSTGYILSCQSNPLSDIILEAKYFPELAGQTREIIPCKIHSIEHVAEDVVIITLRTPPTKKLQYLAGQYVDLLYKDIRRSYSIANIANKDGLIELHLRYVEGGILSELVFNEFKENQLLRLEGPLGTFFTRQSEMPIIFLAGGTGFAPIKAMVEELITKDIKRDIAIYWGMPKSKSFYGDYEKVWAKKLNKLKFTKVVSQDDVSWTGRKGFVHNAVLEDYASLAEFEVYACGSPLMIEAAKRDFLQVGLKEEKFYSDAFIASK